MTNHIIYHYESNDIVMFNTAMERVYLAGDIVEGVKVSDTALCRVYGETALEPMKRMGYYHLCSGARIPVVKIISKKVSLLVIYE